MLLAQMLRYHLYIALFAAQHALLTKKIRCYDSHSFVFSPLLARCVLYESRVNNVTQYKLMVFITPTRFEYIHVRSDKTSLFYTVGFYKYHRLYYVSLIYLTHELYSK